jgi:hypothetical protein
MLLGLVPACAVPKVYAQGVRVMAQDPSGAAIAGLKVSQDGAELGATGADGSFSFVVQGRAGDLVHVATRCPEGTERWGDAETQVRIFPFVRASAPLALSARCRPVRRQVTVSVRAPKAPGSPVRHLGHEVGHLDDTGLAVLSFEVAAHQRMELSLDTSRRPDLRPRNPTATFLVTDRDESFVMDQDFTVDKPVLRVFARPRGPQAF